MRSSLPPARGSARCRCECGPLRGTSSRGSTITSRGKLADAVCRLRGRDHCERSGDADVGAKAARATALVQLHAELTLQLLAAPPPQCRPLKCCIELNAMGRGAPFARPRTKTELPTALITDAATVLSGRQLRCLPRYKSAQHRLAFAPSVELVVQ